MNTAKNKLIIAILSVLAITASSCNFNKEENKFIGEWSRSETKRIPGSDLVPQGSFSLSMEDNFIFENKGTGRLKQRTVTTYDFMTNLSNSYNLEFPLKWNLGEKNGRKYIYVERGAGEISNIESQNKINTESNARVILEAYSGKGDTLYYKFDGEQKLIYEYRDGSGATLVRK
jgi:hypothetical protein